MRLDVAVYLLRGNSRSQHVGRMMAQGIRAAGDDVAVKSDGEYSEPAHDVAVFYGYEKNMPQIMEDYQQAGKKAIYIDLGWWGRKSGSRFEGYHKFAVNDRHPTAYFQDRKHDDSRVRHFGLAPQSWRGGGGHVLVAGMSDKAAASLDIAPEEWERWAIAEIRKYTDRRIIYRPKPSWLAAKPIEGVGFSHQKEPLSKALGGCHAVVTHHSNVAVDGLVAGVPAFCWDGVAKPMALHDLRQIEKPLRPAGRKQWLADIAYCQWKGEEMQNGAAWRYLRNEGLVP